MLLGLLMLGAATILLSLGTNVWVLVVSRLLQGFSAAVIYTGGLALLMDTVGLQDIGKWMGFILSFASAGFLISPTLGGLIYGKLGANAVFLVMGIIVVLDIILRVGIVEPAEMGNHYSAEDEERQPPAMETATENDPLLSSNAASQPPTIKDDRAHTAGFRMPILIVLLGKPRILVTMYGVMLAQALMTSFDAVLPIFVQRTFGWHSTRAGLMLLTASLPTLAAPLAGMLSDKYGPRWVAATGFTSASIFLALLPLITHASIGQIVLLCVLLAALGKWALCSPCLLGSIIETDFVYHRLRILTDNVTAGG